MANKVFSNLIIFIQLLYQPNPGRGLRLSIQLSTHPVEDYYSLYSYQLTLVENYQSIQPIPQEDYTTLCALCSYLPTPVEDYYHKLIRKIDHQRGLSFGARVLFFLFILYCGIDHAHMKETGWQHFCRLNIVGKSLIVSITVLVCS